MPRRRARAAPPAPPGCVAAAVRAARRAAPARARGGRGSRAGAPRTGARSAGPSTRRSCPLVRLEEQRRPVRRPDRQVDLVQAALAALEAVLGPAEVARSARAPPGAQRVELRVLERVCRPDQPRLVRVDDASVARPVFTRTTRSPSTRSWTTGRGGGAPPVTVHHAGASAGSTMPCPVRTAYCRASRSASLSPMLRNTSTSRRRTRAARPGPSGRTARRRSPPRARRQPRSRWAARGCGRGWSLAVHAWLSIAVPGLRPRRRRTNVPLWPGPAPDRLHRVNARVERRRR